MTSRLAKKLVRIAESDREFLSLMRTIRKFCPELFTISSQEQSSNYNNLGFSNRIKSNIDLKAKQPNVLGGKPILKFITDIQASGAFDVWSAKDSDYENVIIPSAEIEKRNYEFRLIRRTYEDFPKYFDHAKVPWIPEYFGKSITTVLNQWESSPSSMEMELIKLRNSHYEDDSEIVLEKKTEKTEKEEDIA